MAIIIDPIVDVIEDVIDWVAGSVEDVVDFVFDDIVEPVIGFVGDTVEALLDNPIETIGKAVAIATGNAWAIPLIDGASVAANGGDLGDVLQTVAVSYVSQSVGGEITQHTAPFVDGVIGEALGEGVKEVAVQAITQGTVAATQAIIYGEDPFEAFARGGVTAGVSAGLGKIGQQLGWEMEVTNPETGQTTTKAIPNVVKNMIGATLSAEITGQEITPALMANALSRGLVTTQLVRDYIVTNPDVGDREIGYIAAALQRTAAVALSGGTGEEAAGQLMGVLSAYGIEELHDKIEDSGVGDFIGDTLDKISGDYQEVTGIADKIDVIGPRLTENYAEYEEKYTALKTQWDILNKDGTTEADYNKALTEYNRLVGLGYNDDIARLVPLIESDSALLDELQPALTEAQLELQRSADRLDGELVPVFEQTQEYFVNAMDPGFNADEYRELNNLTGDVDPYTHFLTEGQHNNVYTNQDQYNTAKKQNEDSAISLLILDGFTNIDEVTNLSTSNINALKKIISDSGYDSPQALKELLNNPEEQEALFSQWVSTIDIDPDANSGENSKIPLGDGVTAADVVSGKAVVTYTDEGRKFEIPKENKGWDAEEGFVSRDDGNLVIEINRGVGQLTKEQEAEMAFTAVKEGTSWEEIKEGLGWTDSLIDMAQGMFDSLDEGNYDTTTNFVANAMKASGGILDAFNGMSTLFGIAPDGTALGKFAQQLQDVGAANNTEEYKEELGKLEAMMNAESDLPEDATWYEKAFDKVSTIAGAAATHPSAFISEYIGVEAMQELVPLAIGGIATLGVKGAAMAMGRTLSTRMAAGSGLTAAAITDIAESYGGSASEAYDRGLTVALNSTNPETGQLFTQEEAESYAMTLAVQTGAVAATLTAATMGIGGMALEKALLGDKGVATGFVAKGIDELASRVTNGVTITIKEGLTESLEEGLATAYREGTLHRIDPTIDVSSEVAGAAFMGFLVGGPVAGGAFGVSQVGDAYSNLISAIDPDVRSAIESGDIAAANAVLDDLNVTDPIQRTNILSQVEPENYVNQAESIELFTQANPDYNATQADIDAFVLQGNESDINDTIVSHIDDRYVDAQEVIDVAAEQGITLTEDQAQEYVGQGPAGHESVILEQFELEFGSGYTSEGEVEAMFAAQGYAPTNTEIEAYIGTIDESTQEDAIGAYVDPRQVTEAEARELFADQGYEPTDEEVANYVGQGNENFESNKKDATALYVDPRMVSDTEARQFFSDLGYNPTDAEVADFVAQVAESDQQTAIDEYVDPRFVTQDEVQAIADIEGLTLTEALAATYLGQKDQETTLAAATTEFDPLATTTSEAKQFFADQGFTPTDQQIADFVASKTEEEQKAAIATFVDPRQVTTDEAKALFDALGYTSSDEEVADFVGQGDADFTSTVETDVGAYVDPRMVSDVEARQFFSDLGYNPTDEQVAQFVAQVEETTQSDLISKYVDPRQVTRDELQTIADEEGLTLTDTLAAAYVGQGEAENFADTTLDTARTEYDPLATTVDEATQFFADTNYTATPEEIAEFVASKTEEVQTSAIGAYVDPRQMTSDEAREFLSEIGYNPTDEEVADFTGELNDDSYQTTQKTAIDEYVDPRFFDAGEVRAAYEELGLVDVTQEDVDRFVGQYDPESESGFADFESNRLSELNKYAPTATFNVIKSILGSPAIADDPNTDVDESKEATGIYAEFAAGATRDEALETAIDSITADLGITKDELLDEIGMTEDRLREEINTVIDDVARVEETIGDVETNLTETIGDVETNLTEDIGAVADLVGKPATEVTQTDIDFVIDLIAGTQVMEENQLAQYDVTGDGQITTDDQILLEQLFAGDQVYDQVADTSIYSPTGTYDAIMDTETNLNTKIDENLDTTMDAITEMEQNIATNIEDEALRAGGRQFLQQALQAPDAMGQQVTVKQPDPLNLRYLYDFSSIFANPQQAGMFPSPYAKGGQVQDTTDKLLNIIGGS